MFADNDKFDSTNWPSWRRLIRTAANAKGAYGYLDGTIKRPSTTTTTKHISAEIKPLPTDTPGTPVYHQLMNGLFKTHGRLGSSSSIQKIPSDEGYLLMV